MTSKINPDGSVEMTLRWYPRKVTKIDLDKLEAIAKAATPGDWEWDDNDGSFDSLQDERSHCVSVAFGEPVGGCNPRILISDEDAAYIAACSPDVVLGLIARVRELERALLCACHAGENLEFAYEDAHRHALQREIERCGALVGRKPGDSAP